MTFPFSNQVIFWGSKRRSFSKVKIFPSWELTSPFPKMAFWRWFFPRWDMWSFPGGYLSFPSGPGIPSVLQPSLDWTACAKRLVLSGRFVEEARLMEAAHVSVQETRLGGFFPKDGIPGEKKTGKGVGPETTKEEISLPTEKNGHIYSIYSIYMYIWLLEFGGNSRNTTWRLFCCACRTFKSLAWAELWEF